MQLHSVMQEKWTNKAKIHKYDELISWLNGRSCNEICLLFSWWCGFYSNLTSWKSEKSWTGRNRWCWDPCFFFSRIQCEYKRNWDQLKWIESLKTIHFQQTSGFSQIDLARRKNAMHIRIISISNDPEIIRRRVHLNTRAHKHTHTHASAIVEWIVEGRGRNRMGE